MTSNSRTSFGLSFGCLCLTGCFGLSSMPQKDGTTDDTALDSGVTAGSLTVDRAAIDFGTIEPGESVSEAVVLTNGSSDTLRIAASLTGAAVFELSDADVALAPGGDGTLTITFSPTGEMTFDGTVGLDLEDGTSLSIALTGEGGTGTSGGDDTGSSGPGVVQLSPSTQDYGSVDVGSSGSYTFTVSNTGSGDVLIDDVHTSDSAFSVSGGTLSLPQVLTGGSSKTVTIAFAPTSAVSYTSDLVVHTDLTPENVTATLSGMGVDGCTVCSPLITVDTGGDPYSVTDFLAFGSPDSKTWSIRNMGDQDLIVASVSVNNDFISTCGSFAISGFTGPKTVAPSGSTSFSIAYSGSTCIDLPQASLDANVVHILSNDPSQGDYVIEVGGIAF